MRPSGKDNGLTYTIREVKTGSGINLAGYPSGAKQVKTSVNLYRGSLEMGGGKSRAEKHVGKTMYNKMKSNYSSEDLARSYSKRFAKGAMHENRETRESMIEEIR